MSTMDPAPLLSDVRRTVAIDFLFLDLSTCGRCQGTAANVETALGAVEGALRTIGARVELRRIHVRSAEQARELRLESSPTIRVNGRDIAPDPLESECGAGACGCGPGASCRLWRYGGRDYTEAPVGLIVDAILAELYAGTASAEPPAQAYELPDTLARAFASTGGGCCG